MGRLHIPSLRQILGIREHKSGTLYGPNVADLFGNFHWTYDVEVFDNLDNHRLIASRHEKNLVTREGIGYLIGCAFQVTSAPTKKANFYLTQIKSNTAPATTNTATTPTGTEITYSSGDVSQTARPTLTLGALSTGADLTSCDNSASKAVFNHLTTITVYGLQLFSVSSGGTSSGYTGDILYGGVLYGTALAVQNGYEVDVQATLSATAG
jgi:hypothetical protein